MSSGEACVLASHLLGASVNGWPSTALRVQHAILQGAIRVWPPVRIHLRYQRLCRITLLAWPGLWRSGWPRRSGCHCESQQTEGARETKGCPCQCVLPNGWLQSRQRRLLFSNNTESREVCLSRRVSTIICCLRALSSKSSIPSGRPSVPTSSVAARCGGTYGASPRAGMRSVCVALLGSCGGGEARNGSSIRSVCGSERKNVLQPGRCWCVGTSGTHQEAGS